MSTTLFHYASMSYFRKMINSIIDPYCHNFLGYYYFLYIHQLSLKLFFHSKFYYFHYLFGLTNNNEQYKPLTIDLKVVGKNLRNIRIKNKKTQSQIASVLNTSQSAYAHYENAIYLIPTNFIFNLSKIYKDFSIDEILGREKF